MEKVKFSFVDKMKDISKEQALPYNLALLTNAVHTIVTNGGVQRVSFTGDPRVIFDLVDISNWGFGISSGQCNPSNGAQINYDKIGIFNLIFDKKKFLK